MANPKSSAEDARRVLVNKFEELTASMASRDAQSEEEMSALTMRIADLNTRLVTAPQEQHSGSRRSRRSRQRSREIFRLFGYLTRSYTRITPWLDESITFPYWIATRATDVFDDAKIPTYLDPNLLENNFVPYMAADETYEVYGTTGRTDFRNVTVTFPDVRADVSLNKPIVLDHKCQLYSLESQPLVYSGFFEQWGLHLTIQE
jgi:hypothetical protein